MNFSRDIHRRRSIRLREYDYSGIGAYFVTMCVADRECLFGEVLDESMRSNEIGLVVAECWEAIPQHFPHIQLDEFVVMPNHIHGIIIIERRGTACRARFWDDGDDQGTACRAPTVGTFGRPIAGSLSTIIRSFKSAVTKQVNELRENRGVSVWQRNYYEHVIRDENDLCTVRQYIADNPMKWADDENSPAR